MGILVHRLLEQLAVSSLRPDAEAVRAAAVRRARAARHAAVGAGARAGGSAHLGGVGLAGGRAGWDSTRPRGRLPSSIAVGGTVVSGIMDLLCREPECWLVTDYKTNALRGRPVAEVAEPYALQCAVYGLAALRAGAPAVQMELLFLEDPSELVTVKYDAADVSRLERELIGAFSGLRQGSFPRRTGAGVRALSGGGSLQGHGGRLSDGIE